MPKDDPTRHRTSDVSPDADTLELPILQPRRRAASERRDARVEVRYRDEAWRISGAGIEDELVFDELADAERRAIELSRDLHVGVIVYGDHQSVVTRYPQRQ